MLILTRKLGESITIGDTVKVTVLGVYGRQVRLGIDAPADVVVHREEIYVKIQEENRKAATTIAGDIMSVVKSLRGRITGRTPSSPPIAFRRGPKDKSPNSDVNQ